MIDSFYRCIKKNNDFKWFFPSKLYFPDVTKLWIVEKQWRIVHRSGKENKIIYKIDKGEKGLIDRQLDWKIDRLYTNR